VRAFDASVTTPNERRGFNFHMDSIRRKIASAPRKDHASAGETRAGSMRKSGTAYVVLNIGLDLTAFSLIFVPSQGPGVLRPNRITIPGHSTSGR
jgi:hypothetical protein